MQENVIMPKYGNSAPGSQKWNFSKKSFFWKGLQISLPTSPHHPQTLSLSQVMQENVIMPKYGNSAPGSQKWNFSKIFHFSEKVSRLRFQRALNHPQTLSLGRGGSRVKRPYSDFLTCYRAEKTNKMQKREVNLTSTSRDIVPQRLRFTYNCIGTRNLNFKLLYLWNVFSTYVPLPEELAWSCGLKLGRCVP